MSAQVLADISVSLSKGNRLDIIAVKSNSDSSSSVVRQKYFEHVFPVAQENGMQEKINFKVLETLVGKTQYENIVFYTWPNEESKKSFERFPDWQYYKSTRPLAWEELAITSLDVAKNKTYNFENGKIYTVGFVWVHKDHPKSYNTYINNAKKYHKKYGVNVIKVFNGGHYESLNDDVIAPDYVNVVEWESSESIKSYVNSEDFKGISKDFFDGVAKFSFHIVELQE